MDQESSVPQQAQSPFLKQGQQDFEQGQLVEIKQKIEKVKISKNNKCEIDGSDSQWSWDSINELKGVDLKHLQAEQEQGGRIEPEHKQKPKLKVIYPQKPTKIEDLTTKYVGNVSQVVGDLLIIQANLKQTYEVVDLDGWVCDNQKNFIGFVIDVFGKIQSPFYAIKPQENLLNVQALIGKQLFYIEGTKVLNSDEIKSIQSKNNKEFEVEQQSSSSDYEKEERQMSVQVPQIYKEHKQQNLIQNRRHRKKSFDHGQRNNNERSRTRQNFKNKNWNIRQNNQQYLQNMYAMHYTQMMQFYHPNYQPNTASFPTMPPPPFGNAPNFVPGNNPAQFLQGNQQQRPNSFLPPSNYQQNVNNQQNQGNNPNMRR